MTTTKPRCSFAVKSSATFPEESLPAEKSLSSTSRYHQSRPKAKRRYPTPNRQKRWPARGGWEGPEKAAVSQIEHESHVKSQAESAKESVTFAQRLASSRMRFGMTTTKPRCSFAVKSSATFPEESLPAEKSLSSTSRYHQSRPKAKRRYPTNYPKSATGDRDCQASCSTRPKRCLNPQSFSEPRNETSYWQL